MIQDRASYSQKAQKKGVKKASLERVAHVMAASFAQAKEACVDGRTRAHKMLQQSIIKTMRTIRFRAKAALPVTPKNKTRNFLSLHFGCKELMRKAYDLKAALESAGEECFLCDVPSGTMFGVEVMRGLQQMDRMICFVTSDPPYAQYNAQSCHCSYFELLYALEHRRDFVPLKMCKGKWPPTYLATIKDEEGQALLSRTFMPSLNYIDATRWDATQIIRDIRP
jgi:hypothetical protein